MVSNMTAWGDIKRWRVRVTFAMRSFVPSVTMIWPWSSCQDHRLFLEKRRDDMDRTVSSRIACGIFEGVEDGELADAVGRDPGVRGAGRADRAGDRGRDPVADAVDREVGVGDRRGEVDTDDVLPGERAGPTNDDDAYFSSTGKSLSLVASVRT